MSSTFKFAIITIFLIGASIALSLQGNQEPVQTTSRYIARVPSPPPPLCDRRLALSNIIATTGTACLTFVHPASARAPGSANVTEAVEQVRDAARDLRRLQRDWDMYATVTDEGMAGNNTDAARRILGGIAPQAGVTAIEVAKVTPLYRIDGAFLAIRKAALDAEDKSSWEFKLDLEAFEEVTERVLFEVQKADGDFYSVNFAAKGTVQVNGIFKEAKIQVEKGILDLDEIILLLKNAGAPGL